MSSLKLTSKTALGKQQLKKINIIHQSLMDSSDSQQFRVPVDWKGMGLTDYPIIIKNPMDLGTIKKKLLSSKYKYVQQMLDDIQLIWDNCKLYNDSSSWIYSIAQKLQRNFKKLIKNYLPNINVIVPGKNTSYKQTRPLQDQPQQQVIEQVPYAQKLKLTQKLRILTQQQLGVIVQLIQTSCPQCFRQVQRDRGHLIIDSLDVQTFDRINEQIQMFTKQQI